jgi:hypothetical protein
MAQQFLDNSQVGAILQHMSGRRVAQHMGANIFQPSNLGISAHYLLY